MITNQQDITDYLQKFHAGAIAKGKGIGCDLDKYIRFKHGTFNMILGHDNVGKTYWKLWHYLTLSVKYRDFNNGMKWCIWTGENKAGQIVRDLIQMLSGKPFKSLSMGDVYRYEQEIAQWFTFVDNSKQWKYKDLLDLFGESEATGCLIDPYTGLDRKFGHSDNYEFLNTTRQWVNQHNVTIDVCTHPSTASGRQGAIYPQGHIWEGYIRSPFKADTEGGKPFSNRCDDFTIVHRMPSHPMMKNYTLITIVKIKDTETGGQVTEFESPILCDFNSGLGFKIEGINPLRDEQYKGEIREPLKLEVNQGFDSEKDKIPF